MRLTRNPATWLDPTLYLQGILSQSRGSGEMPDEMSEASTATSPRVPLRIDQEIGAAIDAELSFVLTGPRLSGKTWTKEAVMERLLQAGYSPVIVVEWDSPGETYKQIAELIGSESSRSTPFAVFLTDNDEAFIHGLAEPRRGRARPPEVARFSRIALQVREEEARLVLEQDLVRAFGPTLSRGIIENGGGTSVIELSRYEEGGVLARVTRHRYVTYLPGIISSLVKKIRFDGRVSRHLERRAEGEAIRAFVELEADLSARRDLSILLTSLFGVEVGAFSENQSVIQGLAALGIPIASSGLPSEYAAYGVIATAVLGFILWIREKRKHAGPAADLFKASLSWGELTDSERQVLCYKLERKFVSLGYEVKPGSAFRYLSWLLTAAHWEAVQAEATKDLSTSADLRLKIQELDEQIGEHLSKVDQHLRSIEGRIGILEQRMNSVEARVVAIEESTGHSYRVRAPNDLGSLPDSDLIASPSFLAKAEEAHQCLRNEKSVVFVGEVGVGKTSLLRYVARGLLRAGTPLWAGQPSPAVDGVFLADDLDDTGFRELRSLRQGTVFLGAAQPERSAAIPIQRCQLIPVNRGMLSDDELAILLKRDLARAGISFTSESVRTAVLLSHGLPLMVRELVPFLRQRGQSELTQETARLIPTSIYSLIANEVEGLRDHKSALLQLYSLAVTKGYALDIAQLDLVTSSLGLDDGGSIADKHLHRVGGDASCIYELRHPSWRDVLTESWQNLGIALHEPPFLLDLRSRLNLKGTVVAAMLESVQLSESYAARRRLGILRIAFENVPPADLTHIFHEYRKVAEKLEQSISNELEVRLYVVFPTLFDWDPESRRKPTLPWGFEIGDGWFELIRELSTSLATVIAGLPEPERYKVLQVKQKFAELRFYMSGRDDHVRRLIDDASGRSTRTCEKCGAIGEIDVFHGYYMVRCPAHARAERLARSRPPSDGLSRWLSKLS